MQPNHLHPILAKGQLTEVGVGTAFTVFLLVSVLLGAFAYASQAHFSLILFAGYQCQEPDCQLHRISPMGHSAALKK